MVAASKQFGSPPPPVDVAWHAFVLHTRDYEAYCPERYGRVIHHRPTGKPDPAVYRRTYQRRSSSGTPVDNTIWAVPAVAVVAADAAGSADGRDDAGPGGDFAPGADGSGGAATSAAGTRAGTRAAA